VWKARPRVWECMRVPSLPGKTIPSAGADLARWA